MHNKILLFILATLFLSSCEYFQQPDDKDAVARVYDNYLYKSDIIGIVPAGINKKDSVSIIRNYINNWIQKQVILHKANQNLSEEKKDFAGQLKDYRNSLVIYNYEKELVNQTLDTLVNNKEIKEYYNTHQSEFELKENIIKAIYIKLPKESSALYDVRKLYRTDTKEAKLQLKELCNNYAVSYYLDDTTWLYFNDLLKEVPIQTYNQESYLHNHRFIEMQDSLYQYFIHIKGFKIKENTSPLSLEKNNIRNIIINKRKIMLIKKMHEDLYRTASENNDFEIY